jgi:hypothetical protein
LDPSLLAWAIFHRNGEERQAEIAEFVLLDFANSRPDPNWHIEDFMDWILPEAPAMEARLTIRVNINPRTWEAVHRKLHMPGRIFDWIRNPATRRRGPLAGARPAAITRDPLDDLRAGGNVVIRIADADPRSYALFLDNFLRRQAELRLRAACSPKLLNLVDEAADIFCHPNRDFRSRAVSSLNEHIRKGRSRGIAFVVSVQNAGDIPQEIRHNLNSFMAGRHKHPKVLKEALPTVRFDVENEAQTLRPGEMLLDLFGVPSLMRSRMLLSPCRLS